ncbi:MAG: fructosamine kinase family protein [Phycisphaerales bacterium]
MGTPWISCVEERLCGRVTEQRSLSGGCIADVRLVQMEDGRRVVAKVGGPSLDLEGAMLGHLRERSDLPVPEVLHAESDLLVMEFIEHTGGSGWGGHLAELLSELHGGESPDGRFGFGEPTLIGPLRLENGWSDSWSDFYREKRLLVMVDEAAARGNLARGLESRLRRYGDRMERDLDHPVRASLIHGDVWGGNVLASGDRVVGLIDPSVVYADAEFELAFISLFSTGGSAFFERYGELRGIADGFFERRVFVYQLFPLLVHVALFGGGYVGQLDSVLQRVER